MQGREGYSNAVELIDEIRNNYLSGDEEKWNEWKATPITELDEKLIGFMEWKVANIDNKADRIFNLNLISIFMDYVNQKLIKTNGGIAVLEKAWEVMIDMKFFHDDENFDEILLD